MKTSSYFLAGVLAFAVVSPATAQWQFGAVVGANFANLKFDPDIIDGQTSTGLAIGVVVIRVINEDFVIQMEPMLIRKGAKETDDDYEATYKFGFIEIPILLKYAFGSGNVRPYVVAGPSLGINTSAKVEGEDFGEPFDDDIDGIVKGFDFGFTLGGGVMKPAGSHTIFGELRYTAGMADLNDQEDFDELTINSSGIQVLLGILFGTQ